MSKMGKDKEEAKYQEALALLNANRDDVVYFYVTGNRFMRRAIKTLALTDKEQKRMDDVLSALSAYPPTVPIKTKEQYVAWLRHVLQADAIAEWLKGAIK